MIDSLSQEQAKPLEKGKKTTPQNKSKQTKKPPPNQLPQVSLSEHFDF